MDFGVVQGVSLTFAALCQAVRGGGQSLGSLSPCALWLLKAAPVQGARRHTLHPLPPQEVTGNEIHGKRLWAVEFATIGNHPEPGFIHSVGLG